MKDFVSKMIERVLALTGMDGMLHIFVCMWLTTYGLIYGFLGGIIGAGVALALSFIKEFAIDDHHDWTDIWWDVWGIMIAFALYVPYDWIILS